MAFKFKCMLCGEELSAYDASFHETTCPELPEYKFQREALASCNICGAPRIGEEWDLWISKHECQNPNPVMKEIDRLAKRVISAAVAEKDFERPLEVLLCFIRKHGGDR